MKRAFVLGGGGLLGSYDAGVTSVLCRQLPTDFIDTVYMSSVGFFQGLAFASGQPEIMEDTWRRLVHARRLISLGKPFKRRAILDLDYLVELFTGELLGGTHRFRTEVAFARPLKLVCVLTDWHTGQRLVVRLEPDNVWKVARGTCAIPYLYPPVAFGGRWVVDGGLVDAFPLHLALEDGHDEVIGVYNKPVSYCVSPLENSFCYLAGLTLPAHLGGLVRNMEKKRIETEALFDDPRVRVIRPSSPLPLRSMVDTDQRRLHTAFDLGVADASRFNFAP